MKQTIQSLLQSMPPYPSLAPYARILESEQTFCFDTEQTRTTKASTQDTKEVPLIFIHGLGDEADSFRHLFPLLKKNRRLIALDLPGFGRSIAKGATSIKKCIHAVECVLQETGPAILIGNSMGAGIAELTAFKNPQLVRALVFIDGGLPSGMKSSFGLILALFPSLTAKGYKAWRTKKEKVYDSLRSYYANLDELPKEDQDFLQKRVRARIESDSQCKAYTTSFSSYIATALFKTPFISKKWKNCTIPSLLIWGIEDRILPLSSAQPLTRLRPNLNFIKISKAAHLPHQENPTKVAEAILEFIERTSKNETSF